LYRRPPRPQPRQEIFERRDPLAALLVVEVANPRLEQAVEREPATTWRALAGCQDRSVRRQHGESRGDSMAAPPLRNVVAARTAAIPVLP